MAEQDTSKATGKTIQDEARDVGEEVRTAAGDMAEAARDKAYEYAGQARERAYEYGEDAKNSAADETSKVASALRNASSDLQAGSPQEQLFGRMAEGVADFADSLRGMHVDEIGGEVTSFARRNPAAFLGGAALLGFAAGRFLTSSARGHSDHRSDDHQDPYVPTSTHNPGRPLNGPGKHANDTAAGGSGPGGPLK